MRFKTSWAQFQSTCFSWIPCAQSQSEHTSWCSKWPTFRDFSIAIFVASEVVNEAGGGGVICRSKCENNSSTREKIQPVEIITKSESSALFLCACVCVKVDVVDGSLQIENFLLRNTSSKSSHLIDGEIHYSAPTSLNYISEVGKTFHIFSCFTSKTDPLQPGLHEGKKQLNAIYMSDPFNWSAKELLQPRISHLSWLQGGQCVSGKFETAHPATPPHQHLAHQFKRKKRIMKSDCKTKSWELKKQFSTRPFSPVSKHHPPAVQKINKRCRSSWRGFSTKQLRSIFHQRNRAWWPHMVVRSFIALRQLPFTTSSD